LYVKFRLLNNHDKSVAKDDKSYYFVISYIKHSADKFLQYFKNISNFKLAFYGINKLSKFTEVHKTSLPNLSHSNMGIKLNAYTVKLHILNKHNDY